MNMIWFKAAAIRAVKTMAQAAIAMIGTAAVVSEVDWKYVYSAVILSGILSLLTSLAGLPEVDMVNRPAEGEKEPENDKG